MSRGEPTTMNLVCLTRIGFGRLASAKLQWDQLPNDSRISRSVYSNASHYPHYHELNLAGRGKVWHECTTWKKAELQGGAGILEIAEAEQGPNGLVGSEGRGHSPLLSGIFAKFFFLNFFYKSMSFGLINCRKVKGKSSVLNC